jgi:pimeloyl-ACP methyl ester carboxylesterase
MKYSILQSALFCATTNAFIPPQHKQPSTTFALKATISPSLLDQTFTPPDTIGKGEITEQACADAAAKMKRVKVPVPEYVSSSGEVGVSFVHWEAEKKTSALPIILVHGFDSSCLEYRRLGPKLAALGIETYAVDLLGWGYSQLEGVDTFSAQAKVDALSGFWEVVGNGKPVSVAGASLGGAAAIEFAAAYPDVVKGCVFIDAQGFIDGTGPMAMLPKFLAEAGVEVLKSVPLRNSANKMSYYDADTFATEDALKVGRLHCLQDGWSNALVSFMLSGGFSPSAKVEKIESPSLILWGRQDNILEIDFAQKFVDTLPNAELRWVEECGHVPHLEQSEIAAEEIANFLMSDKFPSNNSVNNNVMKMISDAFGIS